MAGFREITIMAMTGTAMAVATVPAIGAAGDLLSLRSVAPVSLNELGSIGSFTPSIRDDKLSNSYAQAVLGRGSKNFRFTPTSGSMSGRRSITILVRANSGLGGSQDRSASLGIAPLAFNLDASRGWRKFALPDSVGSKPLDPMVTELSGVKDFSIERKTGSRLKADLHLDAKRDTGTAPQTFAGERQLSIDAATSYSLTRNLNVKAGVRLAGPDNRLAPITDQRRDDQAVYVGTVFKF